MADGQPLSLRYHIGRELLLDVPHTCKQGERILHEVGREHLRTGNMVAASIQQKDKGSKGRQMMTFQVEMWHLFPQQ